MAIVFAPDRGALAVMAAVWMAMRVNAAGRLVLDFLRVVRRPEQSRADQAEYHAAG